jgi:hypothetical protein
VAERDEKAFSHLRSNSRAMSSSVFPSAVRLHFEAARPRIPSCVLPPLSVAPADPLPPLPLLRDIPLSLLPLPPPLEKRPCVKRSASCVLQKHLDLLPGFPSLLPLPSLLCLCRAAVKRSRLVKWHFDQWHFDQKTLPFCSSELLLGLSLQMCEDHGGSLHDPGVSSHREICQEPRLDEKADSRHRDREVLVEAPASRDESFRKCILATRAALLAVAILYAAFRGRSDDTLQVGADPPEKSMSCCHTRPCIQ